MPSRLLYLRFPFAKMSSARFMLGAVSAGVGYLLLREAIWHRAVAGVDGMRSVAANVPGAIPPLPLTPPPPPLPAGLDAAWNAALDALRR